jgi:hypothetical protein
MLSEDFGHISFMRVTTLTTMGTVLGVWVYKNITSPTFVDFGSESAMVVLTCLGAKVAQKFAEAAQTTKEKELDMLKSNSEEE